MTKSFPTQGEYRGVVLHKFQSEMRLEVVRADIDRIFEEMDITALARLAEDVSCAPESRLLATAKVQMLWELAAEQRAERPDVKLERVAASVAGLDSETWIDPNFFCSLLDTWDHNATSPAKRETPLVDDF